MTKRAIVIGSTGLVGSHLMDILIRSTHIDRVVSLTRRSVDYASDKVDNYVVDFDNIEAYSGLFDGDVLFSCLGTTLKYAGSLEAQRVVDFDYQYRAAQIALERGVNHYFLVSSSGANAASRSPYLNMKGKLEDAVTQLDFPHISILQPSLLLGNRVVKRPIEGLAAVVMPTLCKLPGLRKYRPIHAKQVAEKLMELTIAPELKVEKFHLHQVFPDNCA